MEKTVNRKIGVIYDTSYLMNGMAIEEIIDFQSRLQIEVHQFVPDEVLHELKSHFDNPEKEQQARRARG